MSLAREHFERKRALLAQAAKAEATQAEEASKVRAAKRKRTSVAPRPPARKPAEAAKAYQAPSRSTPAARKRLKLAAAKTAQAANDNAVSAEATPYELIRQQLGDDMRRLKAVQSIAARIDLKRQILPAYDPWVAGALEAGRNGEAIQDEIVMNVMIWRFDVADYEAGLEIAEHALAHDLKLPERFNRTLGTFIAEAVADAALDAETRQADFPHGVLDRTQQLTETADMPDQVRAKLFKAMGLELLRLADNPPEGQDAAGWRPSHLSESLRCLARAYELHSGVGVKKTIERVTAELKKEG